MGIVAAQCRALSLKTTSALPVVSILTCFFSIIAASQPVPLPAGSPIPSRSRRFHRRSMPRISSYRLSACSSSRQAGRPAAVLAFRWRSVITFLVSPVPFPLAFSMFFGAYRASPQSESEREGHSVSFHAERPMPSLRYPSRFPACRA